MSLVRESRAERGFLGDRVVVRGFRLELAAFKRLRLLLSIHPAAWSGFARAVPACLRVRVSCLRA